MGPMGAVGIDLNAIYRVMDSLGVENHLDTIIRVKKIYREVMELKRAEEEAKRE